eukprot:TRINITY_DN8953_c1_g1_i1.p1 TRINITY_DN8953_c1_g1~~TRINITY_DN8953_c1_g1_i1.p1  ORF type:complete len:198 (+),score=33.83 TRINITY_DN8953_c1_g1_i1:73-666(+)
MASHNDITNLVACECNSFANRFFKENSKLFEDLESADVSQNEQRQEWFTVFKQFTEEAELTVQNALSLWGVVQAKAFERDFIEAAQYSQALDGFLRLTDYDAFIAEMFSRIQQKRECDAKMAEDPYAAMRPETPVGDVSIRRKLAQLDQRLSEIESERNALLLERRRLVGCEVEPTTASALKREIEHQRYLDDVGLD